MVKLMCFFFFWMCPIDAGVTGAHLGKMDGMEQTLIVICTFSVVWWAWADAIFVHQAQKASGFQLEAYPGSFQASTDSACLSGHLASLTQSAVRVPW